MNEIVVLDPSVRIEELAARKPNMWSRGAEVRRGWLLVHHGLEHAAVLPPGRGLSQFVEGLRTPTPIAQLVEPADIGSDALAWRLLDGLVRRGFAYRLTSASVDDAVFERARDDWRERAPELRRVVHARMDAGCAEVLQRVCSAAAAPVLELVSAGDARDAELAEALSRARAAGELRVHAIVVELTAATCDPTLRTALRRLRATVRLPAFEVALARELVADRLSVVCRHAIGAELLRDDTVAELARVAGAEHVTGLELEVDWSRLDGDPAAVARAVCDRRDALADAIGDVRVCGLPSDDQIAGEAVGGAARPASAIEREVRTLHLERRARYLAEIEGRYVWAQYPDAEELWVPAADDCLPNRPDLLGLHDGSIVADIAGGFGRVARRLAPLVGTGVVISIEKEPVFSARARRFASELGAHDVELRIGLCQRIPLADRTVDAAVLEWGGEIHRGGLLGACIQEMKRIVRPGGRIAITYRLCAIQLDNVTEVFATAPTIYPALREAIEAAGLAITIEKLWVMRPRVSEAPIAAFEERFLPRILDDLRGRTLPAQPPTADLTLTAIADVSH